MKRLALLPFIIASLGINTPVQAAAKWYWAYIEKNQQVISYNVSGNVHVLLEGVGPSNLYRIDDDTAVVMIWRTHQFSAYVLTSDNAYLVSELYSGEFPDDPLAHPAGVQALALMYPYMLIWNFDYSSHFIFNRETHTVEKLNLDRWETVRVSADGRYLRYFIDDEKGNNLKLHWRLVEYDVVKAVARTIFERKEDKPAEADSIYEGCKPDTHGEKWFCEQSIGIYPANGGMPLSKRQIIHIDGHTEDIENNQYLKVSASGDWFILTSDNYYNHCDKTCTFKITNYSTGHTQTYSVSQMAPPQEVDFNLFYSEVLDDGHLLLVGSFQTGSANYLLQDKTKLIYLGVTPCCDFVHMSNDGRWRIIYDVRKPKQPSTILVDMKLGRIILREDGLIDLLGFAEGGIALGGLEFYSYEIDRLFTVKDGVIPGLVVDVLPNRIAIGANPKDIADQNEVGIYMTSQETGKKLLVKDAEPLFE
ncbi:MAG: hypothetical protein H0X30_27775 [Anaerolineae bacterium]|nr:hypothetical protein [Anaerolineae bacterium]